MLFDETLIELFDIVLKGLSTLQIKTVCSEEKWHFFPGPSSS